MKMKLNNTIFNTVTVKAFEVESAKSILIICLLHIWTSLLGQSFEPRIMSIEAMQAELSLIHRKLNAVHPEPYHYVAKDTFDARVNRLRNCLLSITAEEWYLKLSDLIASLHDGHTGLYYNQEERKRYFRFPGENAGFSIRTRSKAALFPTRARRLYFESE